ncbi:MAG: methyltransferase domain-containing protein [Candidatus Wallbacteria bacterium]|nr:methyltransferase domain-containing protein [Candidatus Wallbacteria bacterium]
MDSIEARLIELYEQQPQVESRALLGYSSEDLKGIPDAVAGLSHGLKCPLHAVMIPDDRCARVLDIGCGGGMDLFLLRKNNPDAACFGLDLSMALLEQGRAAGCCGERDINFLRGNARNLPFRDSSFDTMLAHAVLHLSPARHEVLASAFRVLKSPGSIVICDPVISGCAPEFFRSEYLDSDGVFVYGGLSSLDDYRELAQKAGFAWFDLIEEHRFDPVKEISAMVRNKYGRDMVTEQEWSRIDFSIAIFVLHKGVNWGFRRTECGNCGSRTQLPYRSVVSIKEEPLFESLILARKLNFGRCPFCGHDIDCSEPFLYIDDKGRVVHKLPQHYHGIEDETIREISTRFPRLSVRTVFTPDDFERAIRPKSWYRWW